VQDAFLKIYRAAPHYEPTATFRTYLTRVVTRLCLDRKAKKRPQYMDVLPPVADNSRGPEALVIDAEFRKAVRRCLARLPAHQRVAIMLRQYEGMSYDEIAEVLEVSPKAVDSLLQRARETLRKCLAAYKEG
jgi:RNA polymerase sigma-70 factor (ECF subfamily)